MTIIYTNTIKTSLAAVIASALDAGATDPNGDIACWTAGLGILLTTLQMSNPAVVSNVNGLLTFGTIAQGTVAGSGNPSTLAIAQFRSRANTEVMRASFGTGGGDINGSVVSVSDGDLIEITNLTYTVP